MEKLRIYYNTKDIGKETNEFRKNILNLCQFIIK